MAINDEAVRSVVNAAPVSAGLGGNDPSAMQALSDLSRSRGNLGNVAQTAIQGAGMGAQAAQGATNPLSAFLQGAAVGMQAPAQIYAHKRQQIQSAIDASPFGITHPDIVKDPKYSVLSGLPTAIALHLIQTIAADASKIALQGEEERKSIKYKQDMESKIPKKDYKSEQDMALDFNKLPEVSEYKGARSAYNQMASAPLKIKDATSGALVPNGAGQLAMMSGYVKMMFPQARQNEGTLSLAEVSSIADQKTIDLYNRVFKGQFIDDKEINKLMAAGRAKYRSVQKQYRTVADLWADSAEQRELNSTFVLSGDTGSGETIDDAFKTMSAQYPGMSKQEIFAILKTQGF